MAHCQMMVLFINARNPIPGAKTIMRSKAILLTCLLCSASQSTFSTAADLVPTAVTVLARENVLSVDRAL
jgi:hypothetical protein